MKMKRNRGENGSTLLLVTGILLVLGVIASFIFYRAESDWARTIAFEKRDDCQRIAESVLQENLSLLQKDESNQEYNTMDDAWYRQGRYDGERENPVTHEKYKVTVIIEDEGSKLNLNLLNEKALQKLLGNISPAPILDWRDRDSDPRGNGGAEDGYYQSQNLPYQARNGFFASPTELLQLKNGKQLFAILNPEVTVYGRVNPNWRLDSEIFTLLLLASGFEKTDAENLASGYATYTDTITTYDDFQKMTLQTLFGPRMAKLKTIFHFSGNYNINFMSKMGLTALFRQIAPTIRSTTGWAEEIINLRPFKKTDDIKAYFETKNNSQLTKTAGFYFTVKTTIIRYRIWIEKGLRQYYLETVQERMPSAIKGEWKIHPLSWRTLSNNETPEVPKKPETSEDNGGAS
jgi:type II secretory pathway component PulK